MKISVELYSFISLIIATLGVIIIQAYAIRGDIRNQTILGMAVVFARWIPYLKDLVSAGISTVKFFANSKKSG